jgi:hypothetical protein
LEYEQVHNVIFPSPLYRRGKFTLLKDGLEQDESAYIQSHGWSDVFHRARQIFMRRLPSTCIVNETFGGAKPLLKTKNMLYTQPNYSQNILL